MADEDLPGHAADWEKREAERKAERKAEQRAEHREMIAAICMSQLCVKKSNMHEAARVAVEAADALLEALGG